MKAISPVVHRGNKGFGTWLTNIVITIHTNRLAISTLKTVLKMISLQSMMPQHMKNNFTAEVRCSSDGQLNTQGLGEQCMVSKTVNIFF